MPMKVHFASELAHGEKLNLAQVNYRLVSFYELKKSPVAAALKCVQNMNARKHSIIDSGLFTLMFGAQAGVDRTFDFMRDWMHQLVKFVKDSNYNFSVVECDVQKLLGVDAAWELRHEMKSLLPDQSIMNVYHLEDGNPDKLIDFASYIAVSIPELRKNVSPEERKKITDYITLRATRMGKRVHLLGCTETEYLKRYSYCYSCDSLSWCSNIWGRYKKIGGGEVKTSDLQEGFIGNELGLSKSAYMTYICAVQAKKKYENILGDQS